MHSSDRPSRTASAMVDAIAQGQRFGYPQSRRSLLLRQWVPVAISLIVQVPITLIGVSRAGSFDGSSAALILLAIAGPVMMIWIRRHPGPIVALISAAAAADFLIGYSVVSPPY